MQRIAPSTKGLLGVRLERADASASVDIVRPARFRHIRQLANTLLDEHDTEEHPVKSVAITFTTSGDKSRGGNAA